MVRVCHTEPWVLDRAVSIGMARRLFAGLHSRLPIDCAAIEARRRAGFSRPSQSGASRSAKGPGGDSRPPICVSVRQWDQPRKGAGGQNHAPVRISRPSASGRRTPAFSIKIVGLAFKHRQTSVSDRCWMAAE